MFFFDEKGFFAYKGTFKMYEQRYWVFFFALIFGGFAVSFFPKNNYLCVVICDCN